MRFWITPCRYLRSISTDSRFIDQLSGYIRFRGDIVLSIFGQNRCVKQPLSKALLMARCSPFGLVRGVQIIYLICFALHGEINTNKMLLSNQLTMICLIKVVERG